MRLMCIVYYIYIYTIPIQFNMNNNVTNYKEIIIILRKLLT